MSLSVQPGSAIMIPVAHVNGPNMPKEDFLAFLRELVTD